MEEPRGSTAKSCSGGRRLEEGEGSLCCRDRPVCSREYGLTMRGGSVKEQVAIMAWKNAQEEK